MSSICLLDQRLWNGCWSKTLYTTSTMSGWERLLHTAGSMGCVWEKAFFLLYCYYFAYQDYRSNAGTRTSKKERLVWSLCYETQHIWRLLPLATIWGLAWESGNPRYQLHRISHCITHLLLCHVMPRKKVVDKKWMISRSLPLLMFFVVIDGEKPIMTRSGGG